MGIIVVHAARLRIEWLRKTGETFSHKSMSVLRSTFIVVPMLIVVCALLVIHHIASVSDRIAVIAFVAGLVYVSLIDLDTHLLPWLDTFAIALAPVALFAFHAVANGESEVILSMAVAGAMSWLCFRIAEWLSRGDIGGGDVVLATAIGTVLGRFGSAVIFRGVMYAFVIAGGAAIVLLVTRRAHTSTAMAFGPFLAVGAVLALVIDSPVPQPV